MTRKLPLPEPSLRFLLRLAELTKPSITANILAEELGDAASRLVTDGYLVAAAAGQRWASLSMVEDDVDVPVDVESETGRVRCFHPEVGFIDVNPESLQVYRLDIERLPVLVRDLIGISATKKPLMLVRDYLWDLGEDYLTQRKFPIYFARQVTRAAHVTPIIDALWPRRARGPSLILTTADTPPHLAFPPEFRTVSITSCFVADRDQGVRVDKAILGGALLGTALPSVGQALSWSADYSVVTVHGKNYRFTGSKQRQLVGSLIEAFEAGSPACLTVKVLDDAGYNHSVNTLAKAFSKRNDWRDFIKEDGGSCWIFL